MKTDAIIFIVSIAAAWLLVIATESLSNGAVEQIHFFEIAGFDVDLERVLVTVYLFAIYMMIRTFIINRQKRAEIEKKIGG